MQAAISRGISFDPKIPLGGFDFFSALIKTIFDPGGKKYQPKKIEKYCSVALAFLGRK